MKLPKMFTLATILLTIPSLVAAQAPARSDWARVEAVPPDTTVIVGVRGARWKCQLVAVDEQTLTCHSRTAQWPFGPVSFDRTLARDQIRWIALRRHSIVAYTTGAAALAGFAVGASTPATDASGRVVLGVLVAGVLSFFGYFVGSLIETSRDLLPVHHIYERP